ncbi:MAG: glucose-6-phosphate isomerase [Chloroflexi bacterium]|nr:glucose-6-phosphate isomerase [Chloroflexota bacterium]MDA1228184.1 glucose-6-phosphate isomerase [Chloroflexota bacterium]
MPNASSFSKRKAADNKLALGNFQAAVDDTLNNLDRGDVIPRIWVGDHTVWKPDPSEISDRLGWLDVSLDMRDQTESLQAFVNDVKADGIRDVVLLGMGGSSLGPEVLRQAIGRADGYPRLTVLDSTVPAWILSVTQSINPAESLFIVSSKSGSTIEPNSLYRYFRAVVEASVGHDAAGRHFVAVTDSGSVLHGLAERDGFRKAFLNRSDIGGRYSVQSLFGLVPAALAGMDLPLLLNSLDYMRTKCLPKVALRDNPGVLLGATMATLAKQGRDKLTLVASPRIAGFGLWVEQLLAESTGKEGKGIVPVADEPLLEADAYGDDRLFVHLRLAGDDNGETDSRLAKLEDAGHPLVRLDLDDACDIAAEFFRWEFATAVAGSALGIQPFDQPNVQQAKDITAKVLSEYQSTGVRPKLEARGSLNELLSLVRPGDYLAIMAYVKQTPETDAAMTSLREAVMRRHKIATTLGYGPRFLHSTGQLHKGGPDTGLFLQITALHAEDIAIPGSDYGFGVLVDSQASGDLDALVAQGRRAVRVVAGSDVASTIQQLAEKLSR